MPVRCSNLQSRLSIVFIAMPYLLPPQFPPALCAQPEFPRPVRKRQAQTLKFRVPGPDRRFNFR